MLRLRAGIRRRRPGFSLLEIMIVMTIVSLLLTIAVPNWLRARESTQSRACASNLRAVQSAKEQYAMINRLGPTAVVTPGDLVTSELLRFYPTCPEGFTYVIGTVAQEPTCPSSLPGHVVNP